jgi:redox-sensitive bicupin YhaK (pirin superfamily)
MLIKKSEHGYFDHGWLKTHHHFSFGEYYNEEKMHYGPMRVLNDDVILGHQGFPMHPHRDMEIMSYVIKGGLSHKDSMGHEETVHRGEVQYMSAGTGVMHSEYNHGDESVRLLQIWFYPDEKNYTPRYGDFRFKWEDRINNWLHLVGQTAPVKIHQDVNVYATFLEKDKSLKFNLEENRKVYIVNIEGQTQIAGENILPGDAMTLNETFEVKGDQSHVMVIEMEA